MDLYDFPELYDALRAPDPDTLHLIRQILAAEMPGGWKSIVDPACGPGNWLLPFAGPGIHLAGNDLSPRMVKFSRQNLGALGAEVTHGDMRQLNFKSGPFDVALEASGSVCMLPGREDFVALLGTLEQQVRPGGLVLLTVFFRERAHDLPRPRLLHKLGPVPIRSGGQALIRYESVAWNPATCRERILRTVHTLGVPDSPAQLVDEFELRIWSPKDFLEVVRGSRFLEPLQAWRLSDDSRQPLDEEGLQGEQLLVMRRLPVARPVLVPLPKRKRATPLHSQRALAAGIARSRQ